MRIACAWLRFWSVPTIRISRQLLQHHITPNFGGMVWAFSVLAVLFFIIETTNGVGQGYCVHGGVRYQHGDFFPPNDPSLKNTDVPLGHCMQCDCRDGKVYCETENCSKLNCETPSQTTKICCLHCQGSARKQDEEKNLIITPLKASKARKKYGCLSNEGASWQPTIGPLGIMACVKCTCNKGGVSCKRFECRELPCSYPRKKFGQCCPVCPMHDAPALNSLQCLPQSSEVFVYKTPPIGKSAELIEYGFVKENSRNKLEMHTWDTRQPTDQVFQVDVMPKSSAGAKLLIIAGATSYKHWSRFTRREWRLKQHCSLNCPEKVIRLEETLKLYPVTTRTRCNSDEIDVLLI